jgi:hypothetical protein
MDFKTATDVLFSTTTHDDLARAVGVSVASIRQARLDPEAKAHRAPPRGWEDAIAQIARERIKRYQALIVELEGELGSPPSAH